MNQYITLKGIYEKGTIHLLEKPDKEIKENEEVLIMVPIKNKNGITMSEFLKKGSYCNIGGDALNQ